MVNLAFLKMLTCALHIVGGQWVIQKVQTYYVLYIFENINNYRQPLLLSLNGICVIWDYSVIHEWYHLVSITYHLKDIKYHLV